MHGRGYEDNKCLQNLPLLNIALIFSAFFISYDFNDRLSIIIKSHPHFTDVKTWVSKSPNKWTNSPKWPLAALSSQPMLPPLCHQSMTCCVTWCLTFTPDDIFSFLLSTCRIHISSYYFFNIHSQHLTQLEYLLLSQIPLS